ncbi:histidine phosphatase family protein [Vibrio paucivorans]
MKPINIYLLRHGKTLGEPALNGRTDVCVDPDVQANIAKAWLELGLPCHHIISSPLKRCRELAELIGQQDSSQRVSINEQFQEMDFGEFDDVSFSKLEDRWEELEQFWQNPAGCSFKGSESLASFNQRVSRAWQALIENQESDCLVIAHGGTIRMILAHILNLDWKNPRLYSTLNIRNQSVTHIQIIKSEQVHPRIQSIGELLNLQKDAL